ncbi:MAG TPA: DeoR/GlpR transcriptional regulator [Fastidiosipila sp.]|nr:DeoR/GlpR transcriptional regulator [Fastidiosipila sp.]
MLADVRQRRIVELVERFGWVEVGELASSLDVSQVTVRRDLDLLDKLNLLERRRGGAVSVNAPFEVESTYQDKSQENLEAKQRIAKRAVSLISPGMSLFLDAGTTVFEVAKRLEKIRNLTVITNDLKTALHLCSLPVTLYFLGGLVQPETGSVIANVGDGAFDFSVDISFIGARTIDDDYETFTPTSFKAGLKRLVRKKARHSYLLVDHSKFHKRAIFRVDPLSAYSGVITDKTFSSAERSELKAKGVHIISVAEEEGTWRD